MRSAVIPSALSYPAVRLAPQPVHQRCVPPGPLVLGSNLLKSPTPTADRDRTVSRRSKPSSRTALMGEQPNPWDRLQPQDATSRHRAFSAVSGSADYIFTLLDQSEGSACCDGYEFAQLLGRSRHRGRFRPQSLRGHLRKPSEIFSWPASDRLPTVSPTAEQRLGVHRYKPILARHFCRVTPN